MKTPWKWMNQSPGRMVVPDSAGYFVTPKNRSMTKNNIVPFKLFPVYDNNYQKSCHSRRAVDSGWDSSSPPRLNSNCN